jgi:hypothetical protein
MKLGDQLQHGGRSRFRVSWRPILGLFSAGDRNVGRVGLQETTGTGPRANVYADSVGLRDREPACLCGTLAAFTASNPNIDPPLPPSSSNTPAQRASNARARSSMLPGARRNLANVDRDSPPHPAAAQPLPPHTRSSPNYPAQPTQISVSAVPARDAGGLRCRAAGWRACAPARPVYAGKSLPGRVGEAVNPPSSDPVGLRLRGGPAGDRRSARSGGTGTDLRLCWDGRRSGSSLARPGERSSASPTSTGGRRDFRSLRMLAASCYAETVDSESAGHALQLLSQMTRREGQSDPGGRRTAPRT